MENIKEISEEIWRLNDEVGNIALQEPYAERAILWDSIKHNLRSAAKALELYEFMIEVVSERRMK